MDALKILGKAYGNAVLLKTRAYKWYKAFKEHQEIIEDILNSGRPSNSRTDSNVEKMKIILPENRHISLKELSGDLIIFHKSVRLFLVDLLGMRCVVQKLNFLQKQYHE